MAQNLPLDYAVRNLARRPGRTLVTAGSSALVAALLVATAAFVRGLSNTFSAAARPDTAVLLNNAAEGDIVRSTITSGIDAIVRAEVPGVVEVSSEIHMGTTVQVGEASYPAFVRGVTPAAYRVHEAVTLVEGRLPGPGEVLVGRLAESQMGAPGGTLVVGSRLTVEGSELVVSGTFVAPGTTIESELWTPLGPLRGLAQRGDDSAAFVRMDSADFGRLDLWSKRRLDLELVMMPTTEYYGALTAYFAPIRAAAWALAALIGLAALFGGANTLNAAVTDRQRELATLRAVGYSPLAIVRSLAQESILVACAGGVLGLVLARIALSGAAVRIAMSAFSLQLDALAVLVGIGGSFALGLLGAGPAAWRVLRMPVARALKDA